VQNLFAACLCVVEATLIVVDEFVVSVIAKVTASKFELAIDIQRTRYPQALATLQNATQVVERMLKG
jgi:hypothetical protein